MSTQVFAEAQRLLAARDVLSAIAAFHSAEDLGYPAAECAAARWTCWMLLGDFENAWRESDAIAKSGQPDPHRVWDGTPWHGKRLMIRCLHGLGDTIQFIRYASVLRQTGSRVTAQCHPELVSLVANVPGVDQAVSWEVPAAWDVQMEVTELPRIFRTTLSSIPSNCPYVSVPPERQSWAAQLLPARQQKPRIGLVWQASSWDRSRSMEISALEQILAVPGIEFYSLQQDAVTQFPDLVSNIRDVLDTAALMQEMDLVISADTMAAHLAGALRKPVWILLPWAADWRWLLKNSTSPWYPSARLFRQAQPGVWTEPLAEIEQLLQNSENILNAAH